MWKDFGWNVSYLEKAQFRIKKNYVWRGKIPFKENLDQKELQTYGNMPFRSTISYKE